MTKIFKGKTSTQTVAQRIEKILCCSDIPRSHHNKIIFTFNTVSMLSMEFQWCFGDERDEETKKMVGGVCKHAILLYGQMKNDDEEC